MSGEHPPRGGVQAEPGEQGDHRQPGENAGGAGGSEAENDLVHPAAIQHGLADGRRRRAGGHRCHTHTAAAVSHWHFGFVLKVEFAKTDGSNR